MAWLMQVNGFVVDAWHPPREVQEEALRRVNLLSSLSMDMSAREHARTPF